MERLIVIFLFITLSVFSKEITLNLDKAIEMALDNNASNKISKLNLQIAQAQHQQALSANYPSIDAILYANRDRYDTVFQQRGNFTLSSDISKTFALANTIGMTDAQAQAYGFSNVTQYQTYLNSLDPSLFPEGAISADIDATAKGRDTVRGELQLNYPLYTGGKISSIIEQARLNKDIKNIAIKRAKSQVVFDVKKYFYGYILTNELHSLVNSIYENMKFSRDITKEFLENGSDLKINKTDYLNIKLLTSIIQSTLSKIELNRQMLKGAIANSVGLKYDDVLKIQYNEQKILKQNRSLQQLVKKAATLNPDINTINLALKVKDAQIKESKSGMYPMVNLFGNVSHTYNSYEYGYLNEDTEDNWSIGLAIKMSIFDGFKTESDILEKRLNKRVMDEQKILLEEGVALQLKNEFLRSSMGYKQIDILKEAVDTAIENSRMNFKGYQYEMVEAKDLVTSQMMEVYVKTDYLRSIHDYLISLATIDKLVGDKVNKEF